MSSSDDDSSEHIRYSDFFVTVNTHYKYDADLFDALHGAIKRSLAPATAELFNVKSADDIRDSRVSDVGIELTKNRQQLHAHFIWEITHSTTLSIGPKLSSDGKGINARMQAFFDEALGIEGTYCHVMLLRERSYAKNYARKGGQNRTFLPDTTLRFTPGSNKNS